METLPAGPGSANEAFERRKRRAEARLKLAFLKRHDRIVESYHRLNSREDLPRWEIDAWRETRRQEYRRATGVAIEQRDALKSKLQHTAETGDRSVEEVIEELQRDYANGLSSAGGASERTRAESS